MFKKLIITILIGLLAYPPFAFAGGIFDSKTFPGLEPETYDSCFFYWNQSDTRMYGDGSEMIDGSGGRNFGEQGTGAKQPGEYATYLDFDGTDDFMSQAVIASHTGLTSADSRCSFVTDQSWLAWKDLDFSDYASTAGTYEVVVEDSAGKRAKGYLKAVGGGETWGVEALDDPGFSDAGEWDDTDDNITQNAGAGTVTWDGLGAGTLKSIDSPFTVGKLYKIVLVIDSITAGSIYLASGGAFAGSDYPVYTTAGTKTFYAVCTADSTANIRGSATCDAVISNISFKEAADCAATGVHVTTTPGGATEGWATVETGFDYNDITDIEIRKSAFSVTGDFSGFVLVRLDDGQPASDDMLFGKCESGVSAYYARIDTAGKVRIGASNDGVVDDYFITDAAVFSNGQTGWKLIGFSYDASASNIDVFVSGSEVASTEVGDVSTAIYAAPEAFSIAAEETGAGGLLAGDIAALALFNDVLTAAEHQQIYNQLKRRFGL